MLNGCGTVHYLFQAGRGQLALINHAKPITEVLQDERNPPRIRKLLGEIPAIKKFGESQGLKPTANYKEYVKLNRPAAVWVVSASEPLRFKSKEWSFPIVGSFPYLGWFDLEDAKEFGSDLKRQGWDVDVRGARAYSTLGWFRDSILSSMIPEGDEALGELVNVVLHESVHATFYIKGQSYFDESIASFVADRLTIVYLDEVLGPDSIEKKAFLRSEQDEKERHKLLHEAYGKLNAVYGSSKSEADKLAEKGRVLAELKDRLKFKREINNATLIQFKTYHSDSMAFEEVFRACGSDWKRFLGAIQTISERSFRERQQEDLTSVLKPLIELKCPIRSA